MADVPPKRSVYMGAMRLEGVETMGQALSIGSRAFGTHRPEDIAEAIIDMAHEAGIDYASYVRPANVVGADERDLMSWLDNALAHYIEHVDTDEDCPDDECDGDYIWDYITDAIDALQQYAPIYCLVGNPEGDGANFGVWPDMERINEAIRTGERVDSETVINEMDGVRIHVSDHGNVEVYSLETGESLIAIV